MNAIRLTQLAVVLAQLVVLAVFAVAVLTYGTLGFILAAWGTVAVGGLLYLFIPDELLADRRSGGRGWSTGGFGSSAGDGGSSGDCSWGGSGGSCDSGGSSGGDSGSSCSS
jgi:hypothetical protein